MVPCGWPPKKGLANGAVVGNLSGGGGAESCGGARDVGGTVSGIGWRPTVRAPQRAGWVAGAKGSAAPRAPVGRAALPGHVGLPASFAPATPGRPQSRTICWAPGGIGWRSSVTPPRTGLQPVAVEGRTARRRRRLRAHPPQPPLPKGGSYMIRRCGGGAHCVKLTRKGVGGVGISRSKSPIQPRTGLWSLTVKRSTSRRWRPLRPHPPYPQYRSTNPKPKQTKDLAPSPLVGEGWGGGFERP